MRPLSTMLLSFVNLLTTAVLPVNLITAEAVVLLNNAAHTSTTASIITTQEYATPSSSNTLAIANKVSLVIDTTSRLQDAQVTNMAHALFDHVFDPINHVAPHKNNVIQLTTLRINDVAVHNNDSER